uniref:Uncharacterized protein n=1 Tax=Denticeps clupeoides TaxID=299321 RepID=A0AAY3ZWL1_9TELE
MAHMFISDSGSDSDVGDTKRPDASRGSRSSEVPRKRQRVYSENNAPCKSEADFQEFGSTEDELLAADSGPFRSRSHSAPPALWAARKYGQQLRRMSDEFDMKRVLSAGTAKQMRTSSSWLGILWSHKESEGEANSGLKATGARTAK